MLYSYPGRCPGLSYVSHLGYQYQQVLGLLHHSIRRLLPKIETSSLNSMTLPVKGEVICNLYRYQCQPNLMFRNFNVFGRSQLLLTTGHMYVVVHYQSPSGDGSYQYGF